MFSLARTIFSPGSAEDRSSLFVWFIDTYGAVQFLRSVRVCLVALHLRRPASLPFGPRFSRSLPVLVHVVSQRARGLRLSRTVCSLAIIANHRGAFLHQERVGVLVLRFSKLNTRPIDTPVYASSYISRCRLQD